MTTAVIYEAQNLLHCLPHDVTCRGITVSHLSSIYRYLSGVRLTASAEKRGNPNPSGTTTRVSHASFEICALSANLHSYRCAPFAMFFWHPHPTFDFWQHHSRHKHHDRTTPSLDSAAPSESGESPPYEVLLEPAENPQELSFVRRWLAVICISTASICVTCASSMVRAFGLRLSFPLPLGHTAPPR